MVTYNEGEKLAAEFGIPFMETSAVLGSNVEEAFGRLSEIVYTRLEGEGYIFNSHYNRDSEGAGGNPTSSTAAAADKGRVDLSKSRAGNGQPMVGGKCCGAS